MHESQLVTPIRILEDFVNQQGTATLLLELRNKFAQRMGVEIEVIHVDVETTTVIRAIFFKCILQQECSFSYTSTALDADLAAAPIDFVDEFTTHW